MKTSLPTVYSGEFRLLNKNDLDTLGISSQLNKQNSDKYNRYRDFVKKYYPVSAVLAEVIVDSEYNDNTYDNQVQMVVVYDGNGDELVPNKSTAKECRAGMRHLGLPGDKYGSSEPEESFFVSMNPKLPDLYVKV